MKKIYSIIALVAMLCTTACMFTSCSKDDEPEKTEEKPSAQFFHARYKAKMSEDIFKYFDVTVTIHMGETQKVYKFDESTKVADIAVKKVLQPEKVRPGRVIDLPAFAIEGFPLRFTTDIKLSEAGQKLVDIAKASGSEDDQMDFIVALEYGTCNEKGEYQHSDKFPVDEEFPHEGIYVKDLPEFLRVFFQGTDFFDKTL